MISKLTLIGSILGTALAGHESFELYKAKASGGNPFDQSTHDLFVNPWFAKEVEASKTLTSAQKQKLKNIPAAFWVDTRSAIQQRTPSLKTLLDAAAAKQAQTSRKQTVLFIHYNLPNRDCAASASNGEICCSGNAPNPSTGSCDQGSYSSGDCSKGLQAYRAYTDEVYSVVKGYPQLEVVAIVEPDSLPNIVTNMNVKPQCS
jgi:cellulose 1,4-beta-cellobiosidase